MLLLLSLQLCQKLQNESQLEYCVQEPNEACIGDGGPPNYNVVYIIIDMNIILSVQQHARVSHFIIY